MQTDDFEFHRLLHSADLIDAQLRKRLGVLGIRPRQARILDALARRGSMSQNELAQLFDITPASMSTMTGRLIEAGLISRKSKPDEVRSHLLVLTRMGRARVKKIHQVWREIDLFIEEKMGPRDARSLAKLTHILRKKLGGKTPIDED